MAALPTLKDVPSYVPDTYKQDVLDAAITLGISPAIVAEQIDHESSFNPNAVSPAGAEGIAQFLPSTFKEYSPQGGSPFNPTDAFNAYNNFMSVLLTWAKGDVHKALAAYNAGQGNWQAGNGYADFILSKAGQPGATSTGGTKTGGGGGGGSTSDQGGGGILSWPSEIVGWFTSKLKFADKVMSVADGFFKPASYVRLGSGFIGVIFIIMGIIGLVKAAHQKD